MGEVFRQFDMQLSKIWVSRDRAVEFQLNLNFSRSATIRCMRAIIQPAKSIRYITEHKLHSLATGDGNV